MLARILKAKTHESVVNRAEDGTEGAPRASLQSQTGQHLAVAPGNQRQEGGGLLLAAMRRSRDAGLSQRDQNSWLHPCERLGPADSG